MRRFLQVMGWATFGWSALVILDRFRTLLAVGYGGTVFDTFLGGVMMADSVLWLGCLVASLILLAIVEQLPKY